MIPLSEINQAVSKFQVPPETIEKDYVICWILSCLSKSKIADNFIFYGGTAIKRIFFEEHRFSEDIDLTSEKFFSREYLLESLSILQFASEEANINLTIDSKRIFQDKSRLQLYINYVGYDEIVGAKKEIRVDFSMKNDIFGDIENKTIINSYSDLLVKDTKLKVMSLNTILANKLGLLFDRTEPRDIYDIYFLLNRIRLFNFNFNEMCNFFETKYGYFPKLNIFVSALKKESFKSNWKLRLEKQVASLEDYEKVIRDIQLKLSNLFITEDFFVDGRKDLPPQERERF